MAINAQFTADFSDYVRGTKEATKSIEDVQHKTEDLTKTVKNMASDVAAAFGIAFSVSAVVNFGAALLESASALNTLSKQTHVGVEDLQLLSGAMSEFGVDSNELGTGLYKLSRGIAGGDESVATGLHKMGLSLEEVKGLQGKELFLAMMDGLAGLQGGLRDSAAADLFGSKLGAAMAGASEDIRGTMATWEKFNDVASKQSVQSMDEFGSAIKRAQANITAMGIQMAGPVAQGFNTLWDAVNNGAGKMAIAQAVATDYWNSFKTGSTQTGALTKLLNDQAIAQETAAAATKAAAGAHGEAAKAVDTRTQSEKFLASLQADAAKALSAAQLDDLAKLKELGALSASNTAGVGVNAAQFAKYQADQAAAIKATEKATRDHEAAIKQWAASEKAAHDQAMKHQEDLRKAENKHGVDLLKDASEGYDQMKQAADQYYDSVMKSSMDSSTYQITKIWEAADAQILAFKGGAEERARYADLVYSLAEQEAKGITDVMQSAVNEMVGMASSGLDQATAKATAAVNQMYSLAGGKQMSATDYDEYYKTAAGQQDIIRNKGKRYYAGEVMPRAGGGPVTGGSPYLVGEKGPELFVPSRSGSIVPSGAVTNHIYVNGTAEDVARKVAAEIMRTVKSGQQLGAWGT